MKVNVRIKRKQIPVLLSKDYYDIIKKISISVNFAEPVLYIYIKGTILHLEEDSTMPIDKNEITKEMIAKAMQCETADELIALANSEGIELTKEEAEAYLAELEDFELDSDVLQKVAGGGVYETVSTIIKEVPNVVKNI